jgi:gliding motility-associated protein GldL
MSENESKFDIWWNSPKTKRFVGAAYSLGASVVIIGAMFKILHLPFAGEMLGVGMTVEAILFALGVLDKPHKEYLWENVYDFDGNGKNNANNNNIGINAQVNTKDSRAVGLNYTETINDDDVKKLSEGIKNLTATAQQFSSLSNVVGSTEKFVVNINEATEATGKFIKNQDSLNSATGLLTTSYQGISSGMEAVEKNTKLYAGKVEDINKNLSSINSIYEIQLKNIQSQSESITQQTEKVRIVTDELGLIAGEVQKMKAATNIASVETENYKIGTVKLSKQIADLNQVYGNMLNALN